MKQQPRREQYIFFRIENCVEVFCFQVCRISLTGGNFFFITRGFSTETLDEAHGPDLTHLPLCTKSYALEHFIPQWNTL